MNFKKMKNAKEVGSTGCIVAIVKLKYPGKNFQTFQKSLAVFTASSYLHAVYAS